MRGTKHLTLDERQKVLDLYSRCLSVVTTAESIGISQWQVLGCLKRQGINPSGARGGACYRRIDDVRRWAAEGLSLAEIGRRVGTTHAKVSAFLKKHDIPLVAFRQSMENNPAWRGGRVVDKDGYILVKAPTHPNRDRHGYMREHRLVMEQTLGRQLLRGEVVHHKDGDKQHNTPDNLELFDSNGSHLAATLKGKCPVWTEAGRQAIREGVRRPRCRRRTATPEGSTLCGSALPGTSAPTPS